MLRKIAVILTLVCLSALVGVAGDNAGQSNASEHAARLQAELNLTAEQAAAVEKVFAEFLPRFEAVRAQRKAGMEGMKAQHGDAEASKAKHADTEAMHADREAAHAKMQAQREGLRTRMQQILNDEQYRKFVEMEAAHRKKMGGGDHDGAQQGSHGEKQGGHSN